MRIFKKKIKAFKFKPFSPKQKKLLYWWEKGSPHVDKDIVIADGAIRSGKTVAMICSFLKWSMAYFEGEDFIIAGKSMGALKRNVIKPMRQILEAWGIKHEYNRSENFLTIGSNTYYLFGANNEASQDVLQGLTAAGSLADEVALFPKSFTDQMIGRCSVEGSKIFMNCNPKGPFHYFKTEFIDKAREKNILYLRFTMDDNLTLSHKVKERFKRMFSGVFYSRYILGLWVMAEGIIYDMFNHDTMVTNKIPDKILKRWVGVDYGQSNATTFILCGLGADGKLYVMDEYYHSGSESGTSKSPKAYSKEFKKWLDKNKVRPSEIFIDPSAKGFMLQLHEEGISNIKQADNDVKRGIELVSSMIENDMLRVHRSCKNLLKELSSYSWDPKAQERGEDIPIKKFDHVCDALRYVCNTNRLFWQRKLAS